MKVFTTTALILMGCFSTFAGAPALEELSSHLFTNGPVVWQAKTRHLPKSLWIYQRSLPHVFPAEVITNAIRLGSLEAKGFPQPSTNQTCIVAEPSGPC